MGRLPKQAPHHTRSSRCRSARRWLHLEQLIDQLNGSGLAHFQKQRDAAQNQFSLLRVGASQFTEDIRGDRPIARQLGFHGARMGRDGFIAVGQRGIHLGDGHIVDRDLAAWLPDRLGALSCRFGQSITPSLVEAWGNPIHAAGDIHIFCVVF